MVELLLQLQIALAHRYTIEAELGRGGMGIVYRAWDVKHARPVAVKVVRPELGSVLATERFLREIQLAAKLQHPHIVPLHDSGEAAGALFYVMPFVEGESLRTRLMRERQLSIDDALQISREVADALGYAHSHDVLHRDIKPENVLLSAGHAVVVDFGIGRAITAAGGDRLTESGISVGTPAYMSPEQATGDAKLDGRSDLYSLACVLYEMLAGHPPFLGATAQEVVVRHALDRVPSLRSARPGVSGAVEDVITKALAKVPADRFTTAARFAAALDEASAAPPDLETPAVQPRGLRQRWVWIGVGVVAVVAGALITTRLRSTTVFVPGRVVVAPFENPTREPTLGDFTRQLATTLPDAIAREGVGEPVSAATVRDLVARAKGPPGTMAGWLARETGAGIELTGSCARAAAGTTCQVDVVRAPAQALRMSVSATGNAAQPAFGAELTERVLVALLLHKTYGARVSWLGEYLPRSLAAVRAFEQGEDVQMTGAPGDTAPLTYYRQAARLDTGWVIPAIRAAWADTTQLKRLASRPGLLASDREEIAFRLAAVRGEAERAFEYARRRFAVDPDGWWLLTLTRWALFTNRVNTAVAVSSYANSAVHLRGEWLLTTYNNRGYALHQLGRYEEELRLARDLKRRFQGGSQLQARTHEVMALAALGEVDSLRRRLDEWEATPEPQGWTGNRAVIAGEELMAHGHEGEGQDVLTAALPTYRRLRQTTLDAATTEVNILAWTGHLEEARRLAVAALARMRSWEDSIGFVVPLGVIAARQGHGAEARRYDQLLAARGDPLGRASIASRLGDREGAVRLLEDARARGNGVAAAWNVHRDPDFAPLRGYPPFERFLTPRDQP